MSVQDELNEMIPHCKLLEAECRYSEAADLSLQARRLALLHGIVDEASAAGLVAAEDLLLAGRNDEALSLYFEVLNEPWTKAASANVQYKAIRNVFWLMFANGAKLSSLHNRLRELSDLTTTCDPPALADPYYYRAAIASERGQFASALSGYEQAFAAPNGAIDTHQSDIAWWAGYTCLELKDRASAERWGQVARGLKPESLWVRLGHDAFRVELLLFDNDPAADEAAERLEDAAAGASFKNKMGYFRLRARTALLVPDSGDPADRLHPARRQIRRFLAMEHCILSRFRSQLLLVDYRLACVRFAAGVPPTDDIYYTRPDLPPSSPPPLGIEELLRRAEATREALRKAWRVACRLDRAWRCTYRRRQVLARRDRLRLLVGERGV